MCGQVNFKPGQISLILGDCLATGGAEPQDKERHWISLESHCSTSQASKLVTSKAKSNG